MTDVMKELEPLKKRARENGLVFWNRYLCVGHGLKPFTADQLDEHNAKGEYLWGPDNWELRYPVPEIVYEMISVTKPVQLEGVIKLPGESYRFYFRPSGHHWALYINGKSGDVTDPLCCERDYFHYHGDHINADYMPMNEIKDVVRKYVEQFCKDMRFGAFRDEAVRINRQ